VYSTETRFSKRGLLGLELKLEKLRIIIFGAELVAGGNETICAHWQLFTFSKAKL